MQLPNHRVQSIEYIVAQAISQKGVILNHVMGTGKTLTAMMFLQNFLSCPVVIVSPKLLKYVWAAEFKKFKSAKLRRPTDITFLSYDTLLASYTTIRAGTILVFDEVHHLRNVFAKSTNAVVSRVMKRFRTALKTLGLTGTMFLNEIADIRFAINLVSSKLGSPVPLFKKAFMSKYFSYPPRSKRAFEERIAIQKYMINFKPGKASQWPLIKRYIKRSSLAALSTWGVAMGTLHVTDSVSAGLIAGLLTMTAGMKLAINILQLRKEMMVPITEYEFYKFHNKSLSKDITPYISYYRPDILNIQKSVSRPTKDFATLQIKYKYSSYTASQQQLVWRIPMNKLSTSESKLLQASGVVSGTKFRKYLGYGLQVGGLKIGKENPIKFKVVAEAIQKDKLATVVFSQFKTVIKQFAQYLTSRGLQHRVIFKDADRDASLKWLSRKTSGILLLGPAYYEGVSIIGARTLHLLEPIENRSKFQQVAGRVRRYRSHAHLAKKDRHVDLVVWGSTVADDVKSLMQTLQKKYRTSGIHFNMMFTPDMWIMKQKIIINNQVASLRMDRNNLSKTRGISTACCIWRPLGEVCPHQKSPCSELYRSKCNRAAQKE